MATDANAAFCSGASVTQLTEGPHRSQVMPCTYIDEHVDMPKYSNCFLNCTMDACFTIVQVELQHLQDQQNTRSHIIDVQHTSAPASSRSLILSTFRAVAITLSPRARMLCTNVEPKPEEVPVMSQTSWSEGILLAVKLC